VQVHAGHGFLLSQFLSPLFNKRTDAYGGPVANRARPLLEILAAVRGAVGPAFPIGVKLNASDQLEGGLSEADALEVVGLLDSSPVDLIDVSGGTYFPGAKAASDGSAGGGPYFTDFAKRARARTGKPIMVTGGFKTRAQAASAVAAGSADVVGLARALVVEPKLPAAWLAEAGGDPVFPRFQAPPPPGAVTAWYTLRITALAEGREATAAAEDGGDAARGAGVEVDAAPALRAYDARDAERRAAWASAFPPRSGA